MPYFLSLKLWYNVIVTHVISLLNSDALIGIRDVLLKFPSELKLHKLAVIEKLRERISDDDKLVREALYQLLKSVIFPGCKEVGSLTFFLPVLSSSPVMVSRSESAFGMHTTTTLVSLFLQHFLEKFIHHV